MKNNLYKSLKYCLVTIASMVLFSGVNMLAFADPGNGNGNGKGNSSSSSKKNSNNNNSEGSQSSGGQKICLTTSGDLRTRGQCKTSRGEVRITAANLATIADIALAGLPAGQTVYGVVGGDFDAGNSSSTWGVTSSLPAEASPALSATSVIVAATTELLAACSGLASNCLSTDETAAASSCTGTTTTPTAPSGKVCVYPYTLSNASSINAVAANSGDAKSGFTVNWNATTTGDTKFAAVWAYTSPTE